VSDDPRELFVVVDEDDRVIEHRARAEVHADRRLLHRSVAVVVETPGGMLWQRRGVGKDTAPGCWDLACTGHVGAEDADALEAARRELAEELGVTDAAPERVGTLVVELPDERELVTVFRLRHAGPFVLVPPELSGILILPAGQRPAPLTDFAQRVLEWLETRGPGQPAG
jgi:isopentenyldiphosphate isomerase